MANNPFISARVSPELQKQLESYSKKTGESKSRIVVNALSAYLEDPEHVKTRHRNSNSESIKALERRLNALEARFDCYVPNNFSVTSGRRNAMDSISVSASDTNLNGVQGR
jgi:hypothetical protein